ncbi:MAG: response regulator transcription factor [Gammaproteobacteria bacterium]
MSNRILIVEDDHDIAHLLDLHLREQFFEVDCVADGEQGLARAQAGDYDLILLDLMLPKFDGIEVCRRLRAASNDTPILMLTAKSSEVDRVIGLEIGADDYLTKPFSIQELLARVKAILRRVELLRKKLPEIQDERLEINRLVIDVARRTVEIKGRSVDLTAREFDLLIYFARNPGRVFSRAHLLDQVWGYGHEGYEHTVNSHINRLRKKIEKDPNNTEYILTVWGVGYKFAEPRQQ